MSQPLSVDVMMNHAYRINNHIHNSGYFPESEQVGRQTLALIEEVGECIGAGRRYLGMARRNGSMEEFAAEVADVTITSYVTAHVFHFNIEPDIVNYSVQDADADVVNGRNDQIGALTELGEYLGKWIPERYNKEAPKRLSAIVEQAEWIAYVFGINLHEAVTNKLDKIYTRGWKDSGR